eukprot:365159-Chlamydomonas_euryale.AAC.4
MNQARQRAPGPLRRLGIPGSNRIHTSVTTLGVTLSSPKSAVAAAKSAARLSTRPCHCGVTAWPARDRIQKHCPKGIEFKRVRFRVKLGSQVDSPQAAKWTAPSDQGSQVDSPQWPGQPSGQPPVTRAAKWTAPSDQGSQVDSPQWPGQPSGQPPVTRAAKWTASSDQGSQVDSPQ